MNKTSEREILAKLSHHISGIELRHYRTIELEAGNAETIVDTLLTSFDEDDKGGRKLYMDEKEK